MSFSAVKQFEQQLADWWGAPYAVATDCCTHAIELCLRYKRATSIHTVPKHTYVSIPMTLEKVDLPWDWTDEEWYSFYEIGTSGIIDSAVYWKKGGYIDLSLQCLSFQFKKPLNLGRGGAILCSTLDEYNRLKSMAYDGRDQNSDTYWGDQQISTMGYHYYMTPETAVMGMERLPSSAKRATKHWSWQDYPDCSQMPVFKKKGMLYYV